MNGVFARVRESTLLALALFFKLCSEDFSLYIMAFARLRESTLALAPLFKLFVLCSVIYVGGNGELKLILGVRITYKTR